MGRSSQIVGELKRRNVIRAGIAYLVFAWLVVQVADVILDAYAAPSWVMQTIVAAAAVGFPVALILAWVYEITTSGVKRTEDVAPGESITSHTGRKLDFIVIGVLTVAVAMFAIERFVLRDVSNTAVGAIDQTITLGVLPFGFDGLGIDNHFQQLSSELGRLLRRSKKLHVISEDALTILPADRSISAMANQVGARFLVSGVLTLLDGALDLHIQVYDEQEQSSIWEETFSNAHLPDTTRQIASQIADIVGDNSLASPPTNIDPIAYEKYLQALQLWTAGADSPEQESLLNESIQIDRRFGSAYALLCRIYISRYKRTQDLSAFTTAEQNCLRAWTIDNQSADILFALGNLSLVSGQTEKAKEYAESALRINPSHLEAQLVVTQAIERESPEIAELQYKSIIARNPGSPSPYNGLQRLYFYQGRIDEAVEVQQTVVRLKPNDEGAKVTLSSNLLMAGRPEEAVALLEGLLAGEPSRIGVIRDYLGTAKFFSGDFHGAAELYELAVKDKPDDIGVYRNLGDAMWQIGGRNAAQPMFRKVLEIGEQHLRINPDTVYLRAFVVAYGSLGLQEEYEMSRDRILTLWPEDPQIYYNIAVAASRLGHFGAAKQFAEQAHELGYPSVFLNSDPDISASGASF